MAVKKSIGQLQLKAMESVAKEKIEAIKTYSHMTWVRLAITLGLKSSQTFTDIRKGKIGISPKLASAILTEFPEIRKEWLLLNEGEMLRDIDGHFGISNNIVTLRESNRTEEFNLGSCFPSAEIAVRNNNNSMAEYPAGCIIVLRRVANLRLLVPGSDYMIETSEYTVVRRLQKCNEDNSITLYSTNREQYPNGSSVFEPFDVPVASIRSAYLVLGYICSVTNAN